MSGNNRKPQWSANKYQRGTDFVRHAKPPMATTRQNGTSHCVVTALDGPKKGCSMPVPMHEIHKGLSIKIFKWFVEAGLIVALLYWGILYVAPILARSW